MQFMRDDPQSLPTRLTTLVRRVSAKDLARRIDCDLRTAENIRRGNWPSARHFTLILRAFARDFVEVVITPEIDAVDARLAEEEREAFDRYVACRAARASRLRAPEADPHPLLPFEELDL